MPNFSKPIKRLFFNYTFFLLFASGCTHSIRPQITPPSLTTKVTTSSSFSHQTFTSALSKYVDNEGLVNYTKLKSKPKELESYYSLIATYSPDSHPQLFPSEESKLSYWINAYNAAAMRTVLEYYPINSIKDVEKPFWAFPLPESSGFFIFQRQTFGGVETNLYYLENEVIRERFSEPRIHFALNCASKGCPDLPQEAFTPERLDEQLEREAYKFFSESRNLQIDHEKKQILLSSILSWFASDFQINSGDSTEQNIRNFVLKYATTKDKAALKDTSYSIVFVPYDWTLNDQLNPR